MKGKDTVLSLSGFLVRGRVSVLIKLLFFPFREGLGVGVVVVVDWGGGGGRGC